jgi:two-component system cell cycle sensor histidine kinase/response regulator CckA
MEANAANHTPREQLLEKHLKYETALGRIATLALSSDRFETMLENFCGNVAEALNLEKVRVIELDWSLHSCLTLPQSGPGKQQSDECHPLARFAGTVVGQLVISDLRRENRFRIDPGLITDYASALAICPAEARGTTFTVVTGFSARPWTGDSEGERFFRRAADTMARVARQQKEQAELHERNARYVSLFESAADAIICIATDGRVQDANPNALELLGYTRNELLSMTIFQFLSPESQAITRKMMEEKAAGRRRTIYESTFLTKAGTAIPVEVNSSLIRNARGEVTGFQGITRDLRSRKRAEQALLASENRFRSVVDSEMIGILFWDGHGQITYANQTFLSMLGYSQADVVMGNVNWQVLIPSEGRDYQQLFIRKLLEERKMVPFESECIHKNGSRVPVLIGGASVDGMESGGVGFVLDITERKQLQLQLQHAQKMEAVGQLAAGIAHDFNNILMGISSFAELLHVMSASEPKKQAYTQQILAAAARAAELVEQLLVFSQKRSSRTEPVNLMRMLEECGNLVRNILGPKCELQMGLSKDPANVIGDPVQLEQVVLNLASNARDAMPEGGVFRISVAKIKLLKPEANQKVTIPAGSYALLTFSDTGAGIKPELVGRIFEPFFTTKETGEGTGLGLAMVYGVVKQCGGYIFVESEPGCTVFRLFLPLTAKQTLSTAVKTDTAYPPVTGAGILLVDDELQIRLSCGEYLRQLGYKVFEAADARSALEIFNAKSGIRMLLTDVIMPGMGGVELANELKRREPKVTVLFMSGYNANADAGLEKISSGKVLMKPIALSDLAEAVAKALRGQGEFASE